MSPPDLSLANPSSLSGQLRSRTDQFLARLIRTNYNTQFAQAASGLAGFRDAVACGVDHVDDTTLCETFRNTAQLTAYEAYAPFVARFHEKPCRESAVMNLLAPGLPDYIARSSSTSGGVPKFFPKYNRLSGSSAPPVLGSQRTTASLTPVQWSIIDIKNDDDHSVKTVYLSSMGAVNWRSKLRLDPGKDDEIMAKFVHGYTSPFATRFINIWRSFLLMEAFFAIANRSLTSIQMTFINALVEMMRYLDEEFDMMVECIANGTIPDLDGTTHVRRYLESNISPDPERAAELRKLGRPCSSPGWCSHVWPELRSVRGISSGSFESYVQKVRWFLGPDAEIHSGNYSASEGRIGSPYNPVELNQYKLSGGVISEFVGTGGHVQSILQSWEVEVGKPYEVVLTTSDGLWRYRLGDVVQISGFDPVDGVPIIKFIERRNAIMRFPIFFVTEEELRSAMTSVVSDFLGHIVDWTSTVDDRQLPSTIGYFVEVGHIPAAIADSASTTERMLAALSRLNSKVLPTVETGRFRKPTIRIVAPGTFSDFRQMKIEEGASMSQVKIPVVLPKATYVTWFSDRVIQELA